MIFKRKIYKRLLEWKSKSNGTKALLIDMAAPEEGFSQAEEGA